MLRRNNLGQFKEGHSGHWIGKHLSNNIKYKISISRKGKGAGEKQHLWKGDKVGYRALHEWIEREFGKANHCENNCIYPRRTKWGKILFTPKRFHWANISGEYKRERSDWKQLCPSCNGTDKIRKNPRFNTAENTVDK